MNEPSAKRVNTVRRILFATLGLGLVACSSGVLDAITRNGDASDPKLDAGNPNPEPRPDADTPRDADVRSDASDAGPQDADAGPDAQPPDGSDGGGSIVIPPTPYCSGVATWSPAFEQLELEFLGALNAVRKKGSHCDSGSLDTVISPELWCAARRHAQDMSKRGFFDSTNPDGERPDDRMRAAGLYRAVWTETLSRFQGSGSELAAQVTMGSCTALLDPRYRFIGVGHYAGLWVIDLAGE